MTITEILQSQFNGKEVTFTWKSKPFGPVKVMDVLVESDGSLVVWLPIGYIRYPFIAGMSFEIKRVVSEKPPIDRPVAPSTLNTFKGSDI